MTNISENVHTLSDSESEASSGSVETLFDEEEYTELIIDSQEIDSTTNYVEPQEEINLDPPNPLSMIELRRKFSQLIETCQDYKDSDEIEEDLQETMTKSIKTGKKLFAKLEGEGVDQMYLACLHAKTCSGIILSKTEKIGASACGFQLDTFLSALYDRAQSENDDQYSPDIAATMMAVEANRAQRTLPTLVSLLGSFDRSVILTPPEITKKVRAPPKRKIFDDSQDTATQHEQVLVTDEQRVKKDKEGPEARSKELLKVLKKIHRTNMNMPINMVELTMDKDSLEKYFTKLFYVAFLARDGCVSIKRKKRRADDKRKFDSDLYLAPQEPPQKGPNDKDDRDTIPRSQHIVSFNAKMFKALSDASQGTPSVTFEDRFKNHSNNA